MTSKNGQTVCLCMIVKNEAAVISRCLRSVRPLIDRWVIVDTGSTDGTQTLIREQMKDLPGELFERPWRDFAHNRTEALTLARGQADYSFIIDADDTIELSPGFEMPDLTADAYSIDIMDSGLHYWRPQMVRNTRAWRYDGVLHEFLICEDAGPHDNLPGIVMRRRHDGARRKDPQTYRRDAAILEQALATETNPFMMARYRFYLAQSYKDSGEREKALDNYLKRAELGFWQEEVFESLYRAAKLKEELGHKPDDVIATYLRATEASPQRAEASHGASRFCRLAGRHEEGYRIAKAQIHFPVPQNALFVEPWIYDYGLLDEYSINAFWSGHHRESLEASIEILASGKAPERERARIAKNAQFACSRLDEESIPPHDATEAAPPRPWASALPEPVPTVLIAILAKQKEPVLDLYLRCIEDMDYPKSAIHLYVRTNNNQDRTALILDEWLARVGRDYASVEFDASNVEQRVEQFGVHEWNPVRFRVLAQIRNASMQKCLEKGCDYYFVADVDNFLSPYTLASLVSTGLPIIAPLIRCVDSSNPNYSNFHADIDANGYYRASKHYMPILSRHLCGLIELPVVHCTYAVRRDAIPLLGYGDHTERHEYVIFSDKARQAGIPQFLDNRRVYGYLTLEESPEAVRTAAELLRKPEHGVASALGKS